MARTHIGRKTAPTYNQNSGAGDIIKLAVVAVVIAIVGYGIFTVCFTPKKTTETHLVVQAIAESGYEAEDLTQMYYQHDPWFEHSLIKCIVFNEDDIHFEFLEFNNDNSAWDIHTQAVQLIVEEHNLQGRRKNRGTRISNYSDYFFESDGKYSITVWVGNTVLYAYSNSENAHVINRIIDDIGYLEY